MPRPDVALKATGWFQLGKNWICDFHVQPILEMVFPNKSLTHTHIYREREENRREKYISAFVYTYTHIILQECWHNQTFMMLQNLSFMSVHVQGPKFSNIKFTDFVSLHRNKFNCSFFRFFNAAAFHCCMNIRKKLDGLPPAHASLAYVSDNWGKYPKLG